MPVETGVFGARMAVELVNDGPVTIVLGLVRAGRLENSRLLPFDYHISGKSKWARGAHFL